MVGNLPTFCWNTKLSFGKLIKDGELWCGMGEGEYQKYLI